MSWWRDLPAATRRKVLAFGTVLVVGLAFVGCVVHYDNEARDRNSRARGELETVLGKAGQFGFGVLGRPRR
jgi:hypothetical protein